MGVRLAALRRITAERITAERCQVVRRQQYLIYVSLCNVARRRSPSCRTGCVLTSTFWSALFSPMSPVLPGRCRVCLHERGRCLAVRVSVQDGNACTMRSSSEQQEKEEEGVAAGRRWQWGGERAAEGA
jgi:hypothetical protein